MSASATHGWHAEHLMAHVRKVVTRAGKRARQAIAWLAMVLLGLEYDVKKSVRS